MAFITTNDGVKLFYEEKGQGRPIVFVNGWCTTTRFWKKQVEALSENFRCITYDPRDFGESEKVERGRRVARYARDLYDLLNTLNVSDAILVGWSSGGVISICYTELFRDEHLAGLVLVDTGPYGVTQPDWPHGFGSPAELREFVDSAATDLKGVCLPLLDKEFKEPLSPEERAWMLEDMLKTPASTASIYVQDEFNQDFRDVLPGINIPTLVACGAHSQVYPMGGAVYMAEKIPGAKLEVFEDSGHTPYIEKTEQFNEMLHSFALSV